eukprot:IDg10596t1
MESRETKHAAEMREMLLSMLQMRRELPAWRFLLNGDRFDDARLLVSAKLHHISGCMKTKSAEVDPAMPSSTAAICVLQSFATEYSVPLNTAWYYVPHRSFGHVSVGAVVSENDDLNNILFERRISNRFTRYARDDITGNFVSLTFNKELSYAEVFFICPVNTTERRRVFIRFDYADFMAVCAASVGDDSADVNRLFAAIRKSNLVREYRNCCVCKLQPGQCTCSALPLVCPTSEFDLEHNSKNMLAQVGCFLGFSYHYVRLTSSTHYLGEFITQCNMNGGSACADDSRRLLKWAVQSRLHGYPMNIGVLQPSFFMESVTPTLTHETIAPVDMVNSGPVIDELGGSFAYSNVPNLLEYTPEGSPPPNSSEISDLSAPSSCDVLLHQPPRGFMPPPLVLEASGLPTSPLDSLSGLVVPGGLAMGAPGALPPDLIAPSNRPAPLQLVPQPLLNGVTAAGPRPSFAPSPSSPAIQKKRRGRRPRVPVPRPPMP